ncbi:hypothetical protein J6590_068985 [Homalodisca vitripennis]|nr:hypothetical protein J6590_068985 [Homalodisca vitripennis]
MPKEQVCNSKQNSNNKGKTVNKLHHVETGLHVEKREKYRILLYYSKTELVGPFSPLEFPVLFSCDSPLSNSLPFSHLDDGTAKTDVSLKSGQPHGKKNGTSLTADVEILWCGSFPKYQRILLASTRVCHPLPALTGEAGSELASLLPGRHDFRHEISALILPYESRQEAAPTLLTYPS